MNIQYLISLKSDHMFLQSATQQLFCIFLFLSLCESLILSRKSGSSLVTWMFEVVSTSFKSIKKLIWGTIYSNCLGFCLKNMMTKTTTDYLLPYHYQILICLKYIILGSTFKNSLSVSQDIVLTTAVTNLGTRQYDGVYRASVEMCW